ncbi:pleiotropic drug resistance protein 1 [Cryptomeria japonica]|uniref:pleiotropic drug resistance protein 1 n=1 Tax=Cryptomeria japonica TaxID=3369 RepID=UPI0027DA5F3B|nr:pleiotropic drug resistance protein 1 [Cryptomeria japonica]
MSSSIRLDGGESWTGSLRQGSTRLFERSSSVFSLPTHHEDDIEALKWAAIEKLPTYDRLRTSILKSVSQNNGVHNMDEIDVRNMELETRQQLMDRLVKVADQDNEHLLQRLRQRIDRVGIKLPEVEVRFENLNVEADVHVGGRALPTLYNYAANIMEGIFQSLHLYKGNKTSMTILHNMSGVVKPGRMTLLLGPPASGKTTLLLALTGKLDKSLRVDGSATFNGHNMEEFVPQRTSAYISQHDMHIGDMTVRETLDFSARFQGVGSRYDVLTELSRREKEEGIKPDPDIDIFMKATAMEGQKSNLITDYVLKILGLDICADTMIGDAMRRGVSGGQKKRVTTGEMIVGAANALFMDEISTGLDSSTTFQIVKCLRQYVHVFNSTMVVSLLQPAPETYDLFDDVILLSEGYLVYQGPREYILEFFESMGFRCPNRKGVADFLQEVTSLKDQEQYWADTRQPYCFVTVKEFSDAFQSFHVATKINGELSIPYDKSKSHPAALTKEEFGLGKKELLKASIDREILLMKRSSFIYIFKSSQIILLALIASSVFFRTNMHERNLDDGSVYFSALFFGLIQVMFNGMAELQMTLDKLPVFHKQRDFKFFPAWAYSLATWIMRIPLSLMESTMWIILTYYIIGFAPNPQRFFQQLLLYIAVSQSALGLFRFIAAVGRNRIVANTFGSFAILVIFVLGGFIISRDDIRGWWIWGYWISPLMYAQNGIAVNEFLASRWQKDNIGVQLMHSRGLFSDDWWYWLSIGALCGYNILFNVLYTAALHYLDPLGKPQALISEEELKQKKESTTGTQGRIAGGRRNSNVSNNSGHNADGKKGMVLPFQPLAMAFDNINYYVDMPAEMKIQGVTEDRLQLLKGISGSFRPGVLTCLMGVSGAGKTTLMDVLAGRKTGGYIEGSITISGYPKKQETFARISGYCEQTDIHSPYVTVYESLVYSAWLRLPKDVDRKTREMFVDEVMELVELTNLKGALVGLPGVNGLSTEQRKRLTIAVELVANPSIIFMDEPTSGLDARAAAIVMRAVRNTVDTGRTVVCTIHQPSIDIFEAFDELVLMKRGGRMVYVGPLGHNSKDLIDYFEAIEGVPKITEGYNPATWMLESSSTGVEMHLGVDFADIYRNSSLYQRNQALVKELGIPAPGSEDIYFESQFSQPFVTQTWACLWKQNLSYWRNPEYNAIRFFFTLVTALMFGTIFWRIGGKTGKQQDLMNAMGSMFAAVLFIGMNNASTVQPVVDVERTVFYREKAAGMYSALPYAFAQVLIEIPYVLLQALLYGVSVYAMMDFKWQAAKFFWFLFFMFFTFLYYTFYGMMAVSLTPNANIAAIVSTAFYSIWMLFCGFLIPRKKIPVWWRWYYWGSPVAWTLYGLIVSQYGDITDQMTRADGTTETVKEFLRNYFGFRHSFLGATAGVTVGWGILFAFIFAFAIKKLNFQNR